MFMILFFSVLLGLQHVFVLQGNDLHLDIKKPVVLDQETDLFWKFNNKNNIVKITPERTSIFNIYKERAEFGEKFTLLLKKVQHNDSGVYAAVIVGGQDQTVAEYKVTVQDPVSPVNLTVTNSSDPCNITVTCSTADLNISRIFRCDAQNCSQMEEKSLKATKNLSSLIIYLQQDTIFCNHSNQVSWKQSNKVIKPQCEINCKVKISVLKVVRLFLIQYFDFFIVTNGAITVGAPIGVAIIFFLTVMIVFFRKCKSQCFFFFQ
uniref:Immunoglobulin subtype domain-containing protein n=1 Tax=Amphilophus citrinellus TaxID=61819 RepID=A0A3Q0SCH6_AMPCI